MTATAAQRRRMDWGYKFVGVDLATSDHAGGRFRYRPGQWATATPDSEFTRGSGTSPECPQFYETRDKVRVKRLWVHPDPIDPVAVIVATRAYLTRADLTRADLTRADPAGAYLAGAYLAGDTGYTLPSGWTVAANGYVVRSGS